MTNDPLYHAILAGLLSSGMHPVNAIDRAEEIYLAIRDRYTPEPSPLPTIALFIYLLSLIAFIVYIIR
jgi:hypothetical protein